MHIPRTKTDYGLFFLGFFGSVAVILVVLIVLAQMPFTQQGPTGFAVADTNGLAAGLFILGIITGLATVANWKKKKARR